MRRLFGLTGVLGALALAGCAREQKSPPFPAAPEGVATNAPAHGQSLIVTPEEGLKGEVSWVNQNLRFVVITFPAGQLPALDQRLNLYRRGLKVGEVKISGPQRDDSIVADILTGDAAAGDEVRDR
jgi:hypothetical protein